MSFYRRYRVHNANNEFICVGTAPECAEKMGVTLRGFRNILSKISQGQCKKYKVYKMETIYSENTHSNNAPAIKAWDDFVTPLREKYGVARYREGKENG